MAVLERIIDSTESLAMRLSMRLYRILKDPEVAYMVFTATGELGEKVEEVRGQRFDFWPVLEQFYGSNRRKGYDRKESMHRALHGWGCYRGWEVQN